MSVGNPNRGRETSRGFASTDPALERPPTNPVDAAQRDAAFAALLRAGDPSAFGLLFDGWADAVYDRISHHGFTTADVCELSTASFRRANGRQQSLFG